MHGRKGCLVRDSIADSESFRPPPQGWPASIGMGGRLPSESVAGLRRNHWPLCVGLRKKLEDHIKACLKRASDAERRAAEVGDPDLKADYLALAAQWLHLARSYEFSESLERFLLDSQRAKDALAPQPPEPE